MYCSHPTPRDGNKEGYTRVPTRACANQNQQSTAEIGASRPIVHVNSVHVPHESTRVEESYV
jgi:hypothetical protein